MSGGIQAEARETEYVDNFIRGIRLIRLAKHGDRHDEKTHGNWARGIKRDKEGADENKNLNAAIDSWKHNPGAMSRNMLAILEGRTVGGVDHPQAQQAQALLDALHDAPETSETLWRGDLDIPRSMVEDGDFQLDPGDEFNFFWSGTSPESRTAAIRALPLKNMRGVLFKFVGRKNALAIDKIFETDFAYEQEHLLSGTFRVESVRPLTGKDVKAIDPFRGMEDVQRSRLRDLVDVVTVRQTKHFTDDPFEVKKHGDGTHDEKSHGNWARGTSTRQATGRIKDEGGFTLDYVAGDHPTKGWAVANKANEKVLNDAGQFLEEGGQTRLAREMRKFITSNDSLKQEGWHWGAWYDTETDRIVFDTSRVIDNQDEARRFMISEDQDAMFNLETFEEIGNPSRGR